MTTDILQAPHPILKWNLRQLYWDVIWYGILAGSTLAFQSVYAARLGASGFQIGLISAGPAVVNLIFTLPSGRWLEGKSLIKACFQSSIWQRLGYLVLVVLPWLFPSYSGQIWGLVLTTLVMSIAGTVLAISFNALFADVVPAEWRAHAVGRRNILLAVSITVTTLLSGQILDWVIFPHNYQIVFMIGATGALLSSYHLGRVRKADQIPQTAEALSEPETATQTPANHRSLIRLDLLKGPFGIFMLSYLLFYTFQLFSVPLFPIAYVDQQHMTDGMIGLGTAIFYGAMMLGSFRLGYYSSRYGHRKVLWISAMLFPAFPLIIGFAKGPELYYLACLIGGAVNAMLSGAIVNRLMERVPANDRPAHMTIHNMALNLGVLLGSLLGPVSADLIGLQPSLFLGAGLRLLAGVFFFLWG